MNKEEFKAFKKEYKNKMKVKQWVYRLNEMRTDIMEQDLHLIRFFDFRGFYDWYNSKRQRSHVTGGISYLSLFGKDVKSVTTYSIPILFGRTDQDYKWLNKLKTYFIPSKSTLEENYLKRQMDPDFKNIPTTWKTFQSYYEWNMKYSKDNLAEGLKFIKEDGFKYFALCDSKREAHLS